MKNRTVKKPALLTLTLAIAVVATGCSSPRASSYGKSGSYSKTTASCVKSGACGGYTRVTSR